MRRFPPVHALAQRVNTMSPVGRLIAVLLLAVAMVAASLTGAEGESAHRRGHAAPKFGGHWVDSWVSMPQLTEPNNMPPPPFTQDDKVFDDATLRQTIRVSRNGGTCGCGSPTRSAAPRSPSPRFPWRCRGGRRRDRAEDVPVRDLPWQFIRRDSDGRADGVRPAEVPGGAPVDPDGDDLSGGRSGLDQHHVPPRLPDHVLHAGGDHVADTDLSRATTADHWYFLSGLEVWAKHATAAAVMLGDSLTDGRGSTTNKNDRWPDQLLDRLQSHPSTSDIAIVNQAAAEPRPQRRARPQRPRPARPRRAGAERRRMAGRLRRRQRHRHRRSHSAGTKEVADSLIAAYDQIIVRAHAQGIRVYGATLTPFGGNTMYDDPDGYREGAQRRQHLDPHQPPLRRRDRLRPHGTRPVRSRRLLPAYDVGDHLHLNPTGYKASPTPSPPPSSGTGHFHRPSPSTRTDDR